MPDTPTPTLERTPDGSLTVYSPRYRQHYHSKHGAQAQARIVYIEGTRVHTHPAPKVLEVGFGTGLNFLTTLQSALGRGVPLEYIAFEFDPLEAEVLEQAARAHPLATSGIWQDVLTCWGESFSLQRDSVRLEVLCEDVTAAALPRAWASSVYLDGFSPEVNPEVWTPEMAARLAGAMQAGGWLATYSAAGQVRRALEGAGLEVYKQRGLEGKREFVTAWKGE